MYKLSCRVSLACLLLTASTLLAVTGCHRSDSPNEKSEKTESTPAADQEKSATVHLDRDEQKCMGLEVKVLTGSTYEPSIEVYGTLESDPAEAFILRAPVAGTLQAGREGWPVLGSSVASQASLGSIAPQLTGADQLTLADRLSTVQAEVATYTSSLAASSAEYQRLRTLNAEDRNASDRALQEAEARMSGDQAQLDAARQTEQLLQSALHGSAKASFVTPLVAQQGGEVSEVLAQPGETVEAGQPIFRFDRFKTLIARLNLPLSQPAVLPVKNAVVSVAGAEDHAMRAAFVAEAPTVQPEYQSQALLFRVTSPMGSLRPGQAIEGWIPMKGGSPQSGVVIPFDAVVRYQGQDWVYVQGSDTEFVRRPIAVSDAEKEGWFITSGFRTGDCVVVAGAQTLLSDEMKSQLSSDED